MLPDYPEFKSHFERRFATLMWQRAELQSVPLALVKGIAMHEGNGCLLIRADGSRDDTPMKSSKAEIEISDDEAIKGSASAMAGKILAAADDVASQVSRQFYKRVGDAARSVGNELPLKEGKLTPQSILEMLEKLLVEFDDDGNPEWPIMVTHPTNRASTEEALKELHENPVFKHLLDNLVTRKREEHRARESNRRLVD